jgi:putative membrane protein
VAANRDRVPFFSVLLLVLVITWWIVAFWFLLRSTPNGPLIGRFLRPNYWWLVQTGIGVLALFLLSLFSRRQHAHPKRGVGFLVQMGIMVLPLLYLPTAVVSQLSPEAAGRRSFYGHQTPQLKNKAPQAPVSTSSSGEQRPRPTPEREIKAPENPSLLDLASDPEAYAEKRVVTIGRVYRDDKMPETSFFCYRLVMFCCAADATPIGVLIEYDQSKALKKGGWVRVEGILKFTDIKDSRLAKVMNLDDDRLAKIVAEKVEPTTTPKEPYLYP